MSDDDELILGGPAGSSPEASGDDGVAVRPPEVEPAESTMHGRHRAPRAVPRCGSFGAWLLVDTDIGPTLGAEGPMPETPKGRSIVGFCTVTWSYVANTDQARKTCRDLTTRTRTANMFMTRTWGFIEYSVEHVWNLDILASLPDGFDVHSGCACVRMRKLAGSSTVAGDGSRVEDLFAEGG